MPRHRQRASHGGSSSNFVLPTVPPPVEPHPPGLHVPPGSIAPEPVQPQYRFNVIIRPIDWLREVITTTTSAGPMVVKERVDEHRGRYLVSLAIDTGGLRDQDPGERVFIHVRSRAWEQMHGAALGAVREALKEIKRFTMDDAGRCHIFPDYSFFKLKALEVNEPDVTQMPKRISPHYESPEDLYSNGYMHTDFGLRAVLRQIVMPLGFRFREPYAYRVYGGFQADVTLIHCTTNDETKIYGEVFQALYKATDSAYIYALDYIDRFVGVNIVDINETWYRMRLVGLPIDDY